MLATLLKPTEGSITIFGNDIVKDEIQVRGQVSYLPEDAGAYENLKGREYLKFMAAFYEGQQEAIVARGIDIADLKERMDSQIKTYSKGMKRRLLIARTLMTTPKVAIMDEPTAGLDVMHGHYVRAKIKEVVKATGGTAIISSHNLLEVEFLCDRVALINKGKIIALGTPAELKARYNANNLEEVFLGVVGHA